MGGDRTNSCDVTRLLREIDDGDSSAREALWNAIYDDLRAIALHYMKSEGNGRTLQPTALVHEAWLRLVGPVDGWGNRAHFFGAVAIVMREILVDDARRRGRVKRGGGHRRVDGVSMDSHMATSHRDPGEVLAVNEAVEKLRRLNERQANGIVCRYYGGMTQQETADALGVSLRTVQADSKIAAAWLHRELTEQAG